MSRRRLGYLVWALSAALSVAWLVEVFTVGRGFISIYLAPIAVIGNLFSVFLIRRTD